MNLDIYLEKDQDTVLLNVEGEIDAYTAQELREKLLPLTEIKGRQVVVHLADVHYIDSTGLGIFIGALKSAHQHGSFLKLTGVTPRVRRLFDITGLDEVIEIDDHEREEAR
ncbi:STAS domain-containing protein [Halalkalibacterium halodurans]|uniref:STAS domain-containing protein n=1 Tax=Halalkalibacterium halodurans TaxID=86665 RepID=UPI002AA96B2E|nr:STAS domain-containing protein [Halalkalibacterium halodurans]MDY7221024.1 STAS domain-containing protein [Halalkalibacterium halodurans]MDY7240263.1 STAS domain-containing protein [Halalkalibacterium halodurans]